MPIVKTKSGRFKIRNVPGSDTKKEKMKQLKAIKANENFAEIPRDPIVLRKEALDKERSARTPGVDLSYEIIKTHKTSQEEADFEKMLYDLERQFASYSPPDQVILLTALEEKRQSQEKWDNEIQDFFRALVERDFVTHEELADVVGDDWVIDKFPNSDLAKEREKEEQDIEDYEDSMRHWGLMSESEFAEMTPELAEKVRIEHEVSWEDDEDIGGYIDALVEEETDPEGRIGFVNYVYDKETNSLNIQAVEVPRAWRRQGVATAMYDKLMQEYPGANMPAGVQTSKGKSFRKAYNKRVGIRPDGTLVVRSKAKDTFAEEDRLRLEQEAKLGDPIAKIELERLKPREDKDYVARLNDNPKDLSALTYLISEDSQSGGNLKSLLNKIVELDAEIEKLDEESDEEEFSDTAREIASLYFSQMKKKRQAEKILKGYGVLSPKEVISAYRLNNGSKTP